MTSDELAQAINGTLPGGGRGRGARRHARRSPSARSTWWPLPLPARRAWARTSSRPSRAVDYLGYGEEVAGYFGTERGRDINAHRQLGHARDRHPPAKRFAVFYHLAHIGTDGGPPERVR